MINLMNQQFQRIDAQMIISRHIIDVWLEEKRVRCSHEMLFRTKTNIKKSAEPTLNQYTRYLTFKKNTYTKGRKYVFPTYNSL